MDKKRQTDRQTGHTEGQARLRDEWTTTDRQTGGQKTNGKTDGAEDREKNR